MEFVHLFDLLFNFFKKVSIHLMYALMLTSTYDDISYVSFQREKSEHTIQYYEGI
jgi:hypothetical protein